MPGPRRIAKPAKPAMKRNATRSASKTATAGRASVVKRGNARTSALKTYNAAAGKTPASKRAAMKPATSTGPSIKPRKVTTGGEAIGAAHQSFFDIGRFLQSLGGGK